MESKAVSICRFVICLPALILLWAFTGYDKRFWKELGKNGKQ